MDPYDNDNSPNDSDADDPLMGFSPEQLRQLLNLGTAPEQQQMLQRQLMQAQALRAGNGESQHTSPMGALFHGLAGAGESLAGGLRENQLNQQMQQLLSGQVDARQMLLQKLLGGGQQQPSPMGAGDFMPSGSFGLG